VITMLAGLAALSIAFMVIAFFLKAKHSLITGGIAGLFAGFLFGLFATIVPGFTHYFGPVEIPDPVVQIGGTATMISSLYPPIMAVVGLIIGCLPGGTQEKIFLATRCSQWDSASCESRGVQHRVSAAPIVMRAELIVAQSTAGECLYVWRSTIAPAAK
jgi:hypothetical protein